MGSGRGAGARKRQWSRHPACGCGRRACDVTGPPAGWMMVTGNIELARCAHLVPVARPVCCRRARPQASWDGSGGCRGGRAAWVRSGSAAGCGTGMLVQQ